MKNKTTEERPWIEKVHDGCAGIRGVAYQLGELASSFNRAGNEIVAEELEGLTSALLQCERRVTTSITEMLHNQVQKGQQEITKVFQSVIDSGDKDSHKS